MSTATKKLTKERAAPITAPFGCPLLSILNKAAAELAKNAQTVLAENSLFTKHTMACSRGIKVKKIKQLIVA